MKSDFGLRSNVGCLALRILFEGFSLLQSRYKKVSQMGLINL